LTILGSILSSAVSDTLVYVLVALGVFLTLRVLVFPDLTVDGSFVTGGSIAAIIIASGHDPFLATLAAIGGGMLCGLTTGLLNTKLRINALLSGILMMVALYSVNLIIMGRPNIPLLRCTTCGSVPGDDQKHRTHHRCAGHRFVSCYPRPELVSANGDGSGLEGNG